MLTFKKWLLKEDDKEVGGDFALPPYKATVDTIKKIGAFGASRGLTYNSAGGRESDNVEDRRFTHPSLPTSDKYDSWKDEYYPNGQPGGPVRPTAGVKGLPGAQSGPAPIRPESGKRPDWALPLEKKAKAGSKAAQKREKEEKSDNARRKAVKAAG
jgi:hypothetical protein